MQKPIEPGCLAMIIGGCDEMTGSVVTVGEFVGGIEFNKNGYSYSSDSKDWWDVDQKFNIKTSSGDFQVISSIREIYMMRIDGDQLEDSSTEYDVKTDYREEQLKLW